MTSDIPQPVGEAFMPGWVLVAIVVVVGVCLWVLLNAYFEEGKK